MSEPVTVDIPHKLGRDEAKDRLRKGLDMLTSFIPGAGILDDQWDGDSLSFKVCALGRPHLRNSTCSMTVCTP